MFFEWIVTNLQHQTLPDFGSKLGLNMAPDVSPLHCSRLLVRSRSLPERLDYANEFLINYSRPGWKIWRKKGWCVEQWSHSLCLACSECHDDGGVAAVMMMMVVMIMIIPLATITSLLPSMFVNLCYRRGLIYLLREADGSHEYIIIITDLAIVIVMNRDDRVINSEEHMSWHLWINY